MAFFQACCDVLKVDIMKVFRDFHTRGKFERSRNALFIALILKIPGVVDLKNFLPISLVCGICKIIAKILANRLKLVLSHNAFIRGMEILNPILIANECLDIRLGSGESGVIYKMDIEKAYDHVNWDFCCIC